MESEKTSEVSEEWTAQLGDGTIVAHGKSTREAYELGRNKTGASETLITKKVRRGAV